MKIKMSGFTSLKLEAARLGISESLAREYQNARAAWKKRVQWYSKKYGSVESVDIPTDIRQMRKTANIEDFLQSRVETIKSRTASAAKYIRERQRQYIMNVAQVAEEISGDVITPDFLEWVENAGSRELSDVINAIGTDVLLVYYGDDDTDAGVVDAQNAISRARDKFIDLTRA